MTTLRAYQSDAIDAVRGLFRTSKSVCLVCPTGGGKTVIGATVAAQHLARNPEHRVLWLAHRKELVEQAAKSLHAASGLSVQTVLAGASKGQGRICVASIDTLRSWAILPPATMVIVDECHHARAETWSKLLLRYGVAWLLGLTATPQRHDGRGLGDVFKALHVARTVRQLTHDGHLVPCRVFAPAERLDGLAMAVGDAYEQFAAGQQTVVFCSTVAQAEDDCEALSRRGVRCSVVDGALDTRTRGNRLDAFAAGDLQAICNVAVLTEGWDCPSAQAVILARGASHAGLYLQMVGRVLRPYKGKSHATLVDLKGIVNQHGLPDAERAYSLTDDPIAHSDEAALAQCKQCGAVYEWAQRCPRCGFTSPPLKRKVKLTPAEIVERFANDTQNERQEYRRRLEEKAREKGYKRGWIEHMYKSKYG